MFPKCSTGYTVVLLFLSGIFRIDVKMKARDGVSLISESGCRRHQELEDAVEREKDAQVRQTIAECRHIMQLSLQELSAFHDLHWVTMFFPIISMCLDRPTWLNWYADKNLREFVFLQADVIIVLACAGIGRSGWLSWIDRSRRRRWLVAVDHSGSAFHNSKPLKTIEIPKQEMQIGRSQGHLKTQRVVSNHALSSHMWPPGPHFHLQGK